MSFGSSWGGVVDTRTFSLSCVCCDLREYYMETKKSLMPSMMILWTLCLTMKFLDHATHCVRKNDLNHAVEDIEWWEVHGFVNGRTLWQRYPFIVQQSLPDAFTFKFSITHVHTIWSTKQRSVGALKRAMGWHQNTFFPYRQATK